MNDFNRIIETYQSYSPCLLKIKDNPNTLKKPFHNMIFSYLIGYFYNQNININDMKTIFENYLNDNFNSNDFFFNFKKLAYLFCNYFENKKSNNIININISNDNNNSINDNNINNNSRIKENKNNLFINNNDNLNGSNNNNKFLSSNDNNNFLNLNNNNFFGSNNNIINNNRINDNNNDINNNNFNLNNIDDFELAQQIAEEEKIMLQIQQDQDALNQNKKCEICLEEFSLLDCTNYFLNCNCVLHNKCFDEMVKTAIENNTLPVKCPNCNIPVHPNFIEDSIRNANPQLFPKYEKFSLNNFLQNNSDDYSSCPTPGCEYMFFFNPGEHNFLCPMCNKHYCLNCKDEWHINMTCQEYRDSRDVNKLDAQFFNFVKGAKFKMCPKCKYWVEKNQGCNHMKCRCGADFCYLCGKLMNMKRSHKCH